MGSVCERRVLADQAECFEEVGEFFTFDLAHLSYLEFSQKYIHDAYAFERADLHAHGYYHAPDLVLLSFA